MSGVGRKRRFWTVSRTSPVLRRVWEQTFGAAPPSSLSRVFLRRVEKSCTNASAGPMAAPSATTRRSGRMVNGTRGNGAAAPAGSVSAGTHLVREWNGRTYQVEVFATAIGSTAKPIRPSRPPSQSESRNPSGQDRRLFRFDAQAMALMVAVRTPIRERRVSNRILNFPSMRSEKPAPRMSRAINTGGLSAAANCLRGRGALEEPWSARAFSACSPTSTPGLVEQIVVYKVDRLTRSLSDFAKLVERLEAAGAVFGLNVSPSTPRPAWDD